MKAPAVSKLILSTVAVLIAFSIAASTPAFADPPLPGAVFTTNVGCGGIDLNIYQTKQDVYLQGGPDKGGENPPPGSYYVQVTDPSGGTVLGTSVGGVAAGVLSTDTPFVVAANGTVNCFQLFSAVMNNGAVGYADTGNPGGEYKVWVSTDSNFQNNSTKTDNFKVLTNGGGTPPPPSITGVKFYDSNVNGIQDTGEPGITGWFVELFTQDPSTLLYSFTSDDNTHNVSGTDGIYSFDNLDATKVYAVCEVIPSGSPVWVATTAKSAKGLVPPNGFNFGNVCLGTVGSPVTLGFWSNKNGQNILTGSKTGTSLISTYATLLNSTLYLRNGTGSRVTFSNYSAFASWLLSAKATNMAYMLSAQLATMELNVATGNVLDTTLIYAPGANSANAAGFTTVGALMAEANLSLESCSDPGTASFTSTCSVVQSGMLRTYMDALKTALDQGNNGNNFVEPSLSMCKVAYSAGDSCAP
jgi:hypothetical protein